MTHMFTRQDLDKAVSKACESLEKENAEFREALKDCTIYESRRCKAIILILTDAMANIANCGGAAGVFCQQIARDALARSDAAGKGEK